MKSAHKRREDRAVGRDGAGGGWGVARSRGVGGGALVSRGGGFNVRCGRKTKRSIKASHHNDEARGKKASDD